MTTEETDSAGSYKVTPRKNFGTLLWATLVDNMLSLRLRASSRCVSMHDPYVSYVI